MNTRYKLNIFLASLVLIISVTSNVSEAVDVILTPSLMKGKIAKTISYLTNNKGFYRSAEELWQEYLKSSQIYAHKFYTTAQANKVSLQNYICTANSQSITVQKIHDFQNQSESDFNLDAAEDSLLIAKLHQLQDDYLKICNKINTNSDQSEAQLQEANKNTALLLAESILFPIYNAN